MKELKPTCDPDGVYSVKRTCAELGVSHKTLRKYRDNGYIRPLNPQNLSRPEYSTGMPLFLAINATASMKVRLSFSMMKAIPSPPRLQLKQWNRFLPGVTANEPVRSGWKGQSPINVEPFLESLTYGRRTSSMARFLTLLMVDSLIIPF